MERLWGIIEKENITTRYCNLTQGRQTLFGIYCFDPKVGPVILLDKSLMHNYRLHRCVLAEEIGHFLTAPQTDYLVAYESYTMQILMSRDERKALQWATDFLVPDHELYEALKTGCRSCFELAEWFGVTEWFMYRKLEFLKAEFMLGRQTAC